MSKSLKQQFNSTVTIKDKELSLWLRALLFVCSVDKELREDYFQLLDRIKFLRSQSGNTWVVKYLKESTRLVMVWVSQDIEYRTTTVLSIGVPVKISGGLPCIIPTRLRRKMEAGCIKTVKTTLTMLNLYRIWQCPPIMKLETITSPFRGLSETLSITEIKAVCKELPYSGKPELVKPLNITTAGPNFKISSLGAPFDAFTFAMHPHLLSALEAYCRWSGNIEFFNTFEEECARVQTYVRQEFMYWKSEKPLMLGKLSKKFEAAGKVRIFAITDFWTQNLFKPLHDWLNLGLSKIAQDGTFDQLKPLSNLTGSYRVSYDLSAATDRLPIAFQVQVLSVVLGSDLAIAWSTLLKDRDWFLREGSKWVPYRYAVGQPMGAYSSFPMLALSHHVIVQIAARRAGFTKWFTNYALLGDDIVIGDPNVAPHYLLIMRDILGVDINLSKSLASDKGVLEFAKRLFEGKIDLSPISPKVLLLAVRNIFYLPDLIQDMVDKGYEVDTSSLLALARKPRLFKGAGKINAYKAVWSCFLPFGVLNVSPIRFLDIGSMRYELLYKIRDFILNFAHNSLNSAMERSNAAKDSWYDAREQERGGLPGDVIIELPSTKIVDSYIIGKPLANVFDPAFNPSVDLYRGMNTEDELWFYIESWLVENLKKISEPAIAVNDIMGPKDQNKSKGQKAWDFWSMVHKTASELPKIKRHYRKTKSTNSRAKRNTNRGRSSR